MTTAGQNKVYDVFLSHSSKDAKLTIALCHFLEARGVRCWMAPRDITAGSDYAEAIIKGIKNCSIMVVVFTNASNSSKAVKNEVERAFNQQLYIIPFRTQDIIPTQSLEFFLSSTHWLDALEGNAEDYFDQLYKNCASLLNRELVQPTVATASRPAGTNATAKAASKMPYIGALIAIVLIIAATVFITKYMSGKNDGAGDIPKDTTAKLKPVDTLKNQADVKQTEATRKIAEEANKSNTHLAGATNAPLAGPAVNLSSFNGAKYTQYTTGDNLSFNIEPGGKLGFSGSVAGYGGLYGKLIHQGNMSFKVISGNVKGSIAFLSNRKKAIGTLIMRNGFSAKVDMKKDDTNE